VGQWVFFEVMITPAADFGGAIKVWMNGQALFDQSQVKTRFPDSALGGFTYVTHKAHGTNLTPNPAQHYVDDVTVSTGRMPFTPPAPVPAPLPDPEILWKAGMESGNLSEWDDETNSGSADTVAVTAASAGIPPKGGNWVMRMSVTGSSGGTRMARFPEVDALRKSGTPFYVSWWSYFPSAVSYAPGNMFSIWQSASQDALGGFHPLWGLFFHPTNNTLQLVWSPNKMAPAEGPHAGETGTRSYSSTRPVPVREWVFFEVMMKPAADFTGAIKVWMNGELLHEQSLVKTRFPDTGSGGFMWFNLLAYGSGLTPTPMHHYADDVTISLGRVPYVH